MRLNKIIGSAAVTCVVAAMLTVGAGAANAAEPDPSTPDGFAAALEVKAGKSAEARKSLKQYKALSSAKKKRLIQILQNPNFVNEFFDKTGEVEGTEQSDVFPGEVTYTESDSITDPSLTADTSSYSTPSRGTVSTASLTSSRAAGLLRANYAANSVATGTATSSCVVLGVNITTLKIWVTFKTGNLGIPKSVVSYGSGATNFNFFVNVSATNNPAYVDSSKGLAVATTTWHGYVLVKGLGASFDKRDTAKFFNGGLYSHTLVNI
jgi:hypothetical protein